MTKSIKSAGLDLYAAAVAIVGEELRSIFCLRLRT